jgi:hypothetical protein
MERERLFLPRSAKSGRASSWDRTGGNFDRCKIDPGETQTLLEVEGPGSIDHIYFATGPFSLDYFRHLVLRMYWDGHEVPSVEVPLGDFFCVSHGRLRRVDSDLIAVNPGMGWSSGLNAYFPMPFRTGAIVRLQNVGPEPLEHTHHIDYSLRPAPWDEDPWYFHANWLSETPTRTSSNYPNERDSLEINLDAAGNYVALDTDGGPGRMVGLHLQIDNIGRGWYGEGDDMVFVDGDAWPPAIHGTGTEEIFGAGACPNEEFTGRYSGVHFVESRDHSGLAGMYRWFVRDPIEFTSRLRWTIEHGHANNYQNGYWSVAYWYQAQLVHRHKGLEPAVLHVPGGDAYRAATAAVLPEIRREIEAWDASQRREDTVEHISRIDALGSYFRGDFAAALAAVEQVAIDRPSSDLA